MNARFTALVLAGVLAATACSDGGNTGAPADERPVAGELALRLALPDDNTAALIVTIEGGEVSSIRGQRGEPVTLDAGARDTRVFIPVETLGTPTLRVFIPDMAQAAGYRVRIDEAVDRATLAKRNLAGFEASFAPVER